VEVAGNSAVGADRDFPGEMRFGAGGKGGDLLVPTTVALEVANTGSRITSTAFG